MHIVDTSLRTDFSETLKAGQSVLALAELYGPELAERQIALEIESYQAGEERWYKNLERQFSSGEAERNAAVTPLFPTLVPMFTVGYDQWVSNQVQAVRRKHVAIEVFKALPGERAAALTIAGTIRCLAKGDTSLTSVVMAVARLVEDEMRYGRIRDQETKFFNSHVRGGLLKRHGEQYKRAYMQAVESDMLDRGELADTWSRWPNDYSYHVGIRLIELLIGATGFVELQTEQVVTGVGKSKRPETAHHIQLAKVWADKLGERALSLSKSAPIHQPCVVPPKPWEGVEGGGYYSMGGRKARLLRTGGKALKRYRQVSMPNVIKSVNIAQASAWKVNTRVLDIAQAVAGWSNVAIDGWPTLESLAAPEFDQSIVGDEAAIKAWKKQAAGVYRSIRANTSRRMALENVLEQAEKFRDEAAIYFPYNMDWRGRLYALPQFNPQGNDVTKGLLMAAEGLPITEEGIEWLAIHGANCAGVDKVTFPERVQWVKDNEAMILRVAQDPLSNTEWMAMDSPFCFLAFAFEWAGVVREGASYVCALPLAFDGSCSGLQHFSAMLRDSRGGAAVNLTPSSEVQDIYRLVAEEVIKRLEADVANGTECGVKTYVNENTGEIREVPEFGTKRLAQAWLDSQVTRKTTKRAVMTLAYGSEEFGFADQLMTDIVRPSVDKGQPYFATEPHQFARYMARKIWDSVSVVVVAAVQAMNWLRSAAKLLAQEVVDKKTKEVLKTTMPTVWVTPDGLPVWQEYIKQDQRKLDFMFLGSIRMAPRVNLDTGIELDPYKQASGMAPNFVHSMDATHLRRTVVHTHDAYGVKFFALIHDSFGTIPAHAGAMFRGVRESFVDLYENNDVLLDFYEQFHEQLHETQLDRMPALPQKGSLDLRGVLASKYAFA